MTEASPAVMLCRPFLVAIRVEHEMAARLCSQNSANRLAYRLGNAICQIEFFAIRRVLASWLLYRVNAPAISREVQCHTMGCITPLQRQHAVIGKPDHGVDVRQATLDECQRV